MNNSRNKPRKRDKVATYIARFIVGCIGISLLVILIVFKFWKTSNIEQWLMFGGMIGLCIGYGFGGDIWGARLFDLFTHSNASKAVEAEKNDGRSTQFFSKIILGIAICFIVFFATVLIIAYLHRSAAQ